MWLLLLACRLHSGDTDKPPDTDTHPEEPPAPGLFGTFSLSFGTTTDTARGDTGTMGTTVDTAITWPVASDEACTICGGSCTGTSFAIGDHHHQSGGISYPDRPPAGGPHDPCWTTWGVHPTEVRDENWVHNLEHGGVVFLYNCPSGCDADVAKLTKLVDALNVWAILTPYSLMSSKFAVVSWGHRVTMDCDDLVGVEKFYEDHVDQAPESGTSNPPEACATEWDTGSGTGP